MVSIGPVEYLVIGFPGNRFKGEIVPAVANWSTTASSASLTSPYQEGRRRDRHRP
jgi:hypothetical protein